jgi:hypothetical protein
MNGVGVNVCTICGGQRMAEDRWFLVAENHWEDKLRILRWSERLAGREGTHRVCSPPHVRELVVHWMTTGSLNYPFARTASSSPWASRRLEGFSRDATDLETSRAHIGELAVHRESVGRALSENPQALNVILDELLTVLRREAGEVLSESDGEDEILCVPMQEM